MTGVEYSEQDTDNRRLTSGYFSDIGVGTSNTLVPLNNPVYNGVITYRAAGNDADNHSDAVAKAVYVQDQMELSEQWVAVMGVPL